MQKVLIISYFAPPCTLTGANRVGSWIKHLPEHGIYPIVITRNWVGSEKDEVTRLKNSGKLIRHEVLDKAECYYAPYKSSLRDMAFIRSRDSRIFAYLSKFLTFFGLLLQNISLRFIPYNNLYDLAREILSKQKEIDTLVISGNPFEQFFFGYLLKKEFSQISWIADYRDDWTTNPLYSNDLSSKIFKKYNQFFEKKWVASASEVLTVTDLYRKRLSKLHNRNCQLLCNGYNEDLLHTPPLMRSNKFQITYSGTIYSHQDFSSIIEIIDRIAKKNHDKEFNLTFLGSMGSVDSKQKNTLQQKTVSNFNIDITERISWKDSIAFAKASDVLLIGSYGDLKGISPSKIFEYAAMGVPVVCYPSDRDIIDEILKKSNTAYLCDTEKECYDSFQKIVDGDFEYMPNKSEIIKFSAKHQVSILAQILKE